MMIATLNAGQEVYHHAENIMHGATMSQILSTCFLGGLFIILVIWLVWKIIDFRLQPLSDVPKALSDIQKSLNKLWTNEQLNDRIENKVNDTMRIHETDYHRPQKYGVAK